MGFIALVLLEGTLLLSAGIVFFKGIWGTAAAVLVLSVINFLAHDAGQFWRWEVPLLGGGLAGALLLLFVTRIANQNQVVNGLVGGLISLVLFGAFAMPVAAIAIWFLVVGTGLIPKNKKSQTLWSFAPTILRIILGICGIVYGNILTL